VKIFNWLATVWGGAVRLRTPMLFALGFIAQFTIGGLSGVMHSIVPSDTQQTDTYFVVAHFHYTLFGGAVFGYLAGLYYWFPKMTGRFLSESLGKASFWLIFIGFNLTFLIQHSLGLDGMVRRIDRYPADMGWTTMNLISTIGSFILALGVLVTAYNLVRSLKKGVTAGPDPWKGNTLEWFTTSPPPENNFDAIPRVRSVEPMKDIRRQVERGTDAAAARRAGGTAPTVRA
jgi:cytochrome c oxidase subunit 1